MEDKKLPGTILVDDLRYRLIPDEIRNRLLDARGFDFYWREPEDGVEIVSMKDRAVVLVDVTVPTRAADMGVHPELFPGAHIPGGAQGGP